MLSEGMISDCGFEIAQRVRLGSAGERTAAVKMLLREMVSGGPGGCRIAEEALVRLGLMAWPVLRVAVKGPGELALAARAVMDAAR